MRFLAGTVLFLLAWLAYGRIATNRALAKAEAVCREVPVGASIEVAKKAALAEETEPHLRTIADDFILVGFTGGGHDVRYCSLRGADGKVVSRRVGMVILESRDVLAP